jgi:SnoaL-like domain
LEVSTSADDLVSAYLRALTSGDAGLAVSLFTDDGVVHSPLYGHRPPEDFYRALFADTSRANLTLKCVMSGVDTTGATTVSFWFHFDWRLPSGAAAPFDVVDVATLGPHGLIKDLHIIYDTVDVRPAFEAELGRRTWHPPRDDDPIGD